MALVEGVVAVLDEAFVAGVVLEGEWSEKVTRAFVGVDFVALVFGFLEIALLEWLLEWWILIWFWAKKVFLVWLCL